MENIRILLCCAAGYSSGILAQKTRKAAKKRNINLTIDARSETQAASFLGQVDIILLAPHYANILDKFKALAEPYNVPVGAIPHQIYGLIDGDGLLDYAIKIIEENQNK